MTKQIELKAKEQDILIREMENRFKKRQKDLKLQMMQLADDDAAAGVGGEEARAELLMDNAVEGEF